MTHSYYNKTELEEIGFRSIGSNVKVSKKSSIYAPDKITIGNNVRIDDFCILVGGEGIEMGNHVHIGAYSALYGGSKITLKDFSGLSARVTIYSESDDYTGISLTNPMIPIEFKPKYTRGPVVLERHVIIGSSTTILPNITLAEGASVGAHSLVTKNCEAWKVYFGAPSKIIRNRSKKLLTLETHFLNYFNKLQS